MLSAVAALQAWDVLFRVAVTDVLVRYWGIVLKVGSAGLSPRPCMGMCQATSAVSLPRQVLHCPCALILNTSQPGRRAEVLHTHAPVFPQALVLATHATGSRHELHKRGQLLTTVEHGLYFYRGLLATPVRAPSDHFFCETYILPRDNVGIIHGICHAPVQGSSLLSMMGVRTGGLASERNAAFELKSNLFAQTHRCGTSSLWMAAAASAMSCRTAVQVRSSSDELQMNGRCCDVQQALGGGAMLTLQ